MTTDASRLVIIQSLKKRANNLHLLILFATFAVVLFFIFDRRNLIFYLPPVTTRRADYLRFFLFSLLVFLYFVVI